MEKEEEQLSLKASSVDEWRKWLSENCNTCRKIYLIVYHKSSKTESISWHDAIEHALCYGWVDSKAKRRDSESTYLKFTPRNPKSSWGKKNKERANKMTELGFMTEHGQKLIDIARKSDRWDPVRY